MKGYPQYKVSGDRWIDLVPTHWQVNRLKYVADAQPSNIDKKSVDDQPAVRLCNYVDVYKNEFITDDLPFMEATATADQIHRFQLKAGDVLVTKDSEDPTDIAVPAVVMYDLPSVVCGYHLTLIRANSEVLDGFYLHRLFQAYSFNQQFTVKANGVTRYGLPAAAITEAVVCIPPLEEQAAISLFLRKKTFLIGETIRKKQSLIELLHEERTVLINQAVTKGLDKEAFSNKSGFGKQSKKPNNWKTTKLKYATIKIGDGLHATPEYTDNESFFFVNGTNLDEGRIDLTSARTVNQEEYRKYHIDLPCGSVFLSLNGTVGNLAYFRGEPIILGKSVAFIVPSKELESEFLFYYLKSDYVRNYFEASLSGTTVRNLSLHALRNTAIFLPPREEQIAIVKHINTEMRNLNEVDQKLRMEIELLKEYRSSLINEIVTGKGCVLSEEEQEKLTKDQELVS